MTDTTEFLDINVFQENKPVTYKFLARSLGIHVKNAKQALYDFSNSQSNVHAVYCIIGTKLNGNEFSIQLVKERDLEVEKKKYKNISSSYVYSIASYDLDDFSILYTATKDVSKADLIQCGVLKNVSVQHKASVKGSRPPPPPPTSKMPVSKQPMIAAHSATKRERETETKSPKPKKQMVQKPTTKADSKDNKNTFVVKPSTKKKMNDDDLESLMENNLKMEDIFSDEEKDDEPQPDPAQEEDIIMMEADEKETVEEPSKELETEEVDDTPVESGKIKRKVLKKKTTTNARGHLVTEEVWEWETVDATDEEKNKPTTAKPAAPKPAPAKSAAPANPTITKKTPGNKKTVQSKNILSFFGKK